MYHKKIKIHNTQTNLNKQTNSLFHIFFSMKQTRRSEVDAGDDDFVARRQTPDDIILIESITRSDENIVDLPSKFPNYYPPTIEVRNTSYYEVGESTEEKTKAKTLKKANSLKLVVIILLVVLVLLAFGLGLVIGLAKSSSENRLQSIFQGVDHGDVSKGSGQAPFIREEYPYTTVLTSNEQLYLGDVVTSPNKMFSLSFIDEGSLVLRKSDSGEILWSNGIKGAIKCSLQPDGNLVLRRKDRTTIWKSATHKNPGAELHLDDGGQIAIVSVEGTSLWLAGLPRGEYTVRQRESLDFPIRGIFYYPWYPETWTVRGTHVFYNPNSGYYSSGDGDVQMKHVKTLDYIHADVAIASWFGPGTHRDRARLTNLMVKSKSIRTKWTVYHEEEFREDQSVDDLRQDLAYLKKWFVWRDTWAHVDNKPLIFVYNEGDCDVVNRWAEASGGEWYVVLKVFHERESCSSQPDGWHQYGPSKGVHHHTGLSYSISPGFWRADTSKPNLERYSEKQWRQSVEGMVESGEPWQLVVSFNEWGEGTAIESASGWESKTGYGYYADVLHEIH